MIDVSIIIPVYNAEKYITAMAESAINQTHKNIEVILVDDGSTDACGGICDDLAVGDSRVRVIHKENGGVSSARNAGLDAARGEYVCFADADDLLSPKLVEDNLALARQHNADIVVFGFTRLSEKSGGGFANREFLPKWEGVFDGGFVREHFDELTMDNPFAFFRMFKREFIEKNGLRFRPLTIGEDDLYNITAFSSMPRTVCFNSRSYYRYIRRGDSAMARYNPKASESMFTLVREFERISGEVGLPAEKRRKAVNRYYIKAVSIMTGLMSAKNCPLTLREKLDEVKRMMSMPGAVRAFDELNTKAYGHSLIRIKMGLLKRGHYLSVILLGDLLKAVSPDRK